MRLIVIIVTGVATVGLCVTFAWIGWTNANDVAAVVSTVVGVVALGATVWAGLRQAPESRARDSLRVSRTGTATAAKGGMVNTGVAGRRAHGVDGVAEDTGDASGSGNANTGIRLD
jgi:hypothetical protein